MKAKFYEPLFYICSEKMPFTIRNEVVMTEKVDGEALNRAVQIAMRRYPYFRLRVVAEGGEYLCVPNDLPVVVYEGKQARPLGSPEVNGHIIAVSYADREISIHSSHVVCDGGGVFPLFRTVMYYYLCERYHTQLDPAGINLADDPLFPDEAGNPYPEEKMAAAEPLYVKKANRFFRLRDGGYVNDHQGRVFRLRIREDEMMRFSFDHDGSPCALLSVLMAKAIWSLHPDVKDDIVSAVSFNLRAGLGNQHSFRMLCSSILLNYRPDMKDAEVLKLCTCSRGMITLQSQAENVLHYAQQRKLRFEALERFPSLQAKKELIGLRALEDSVSNTFSVSYVGKMPLGSLTPYIDSIYNITDGSTWETAFIEISSVNGWFDIAFIQGFSSDVYYRAFLAQLDLHHLSYTQEYVTELNSARMVLPE